MQILPPEEPRCWALHDAYDHAVRPVEMCRPCRRWLDCHKRGPITEVLSPPAVVANGVLICARRMPLGK